MSNGWAGIYSKSIEKWASTLLFLSTAAFYVSLYRSYLSTSMNFIYIYICIIWLVFFCLYSFSLNCVLNLISRFVDVVFVRSICVCIMEVLRRHQPCLHTRMCILLLTFCIRSLKFRPPS